MTAKTSIEKCLLATVCLLIGVSAANAQYSGGGGTQEDPYQIATADDVVGLGARSEDYDKHFVLTADIDLDPNLEGGKVFDRAVIAPDVNDTASGFQGYPFVGSLDGCGHVIGNLHIQGGGHLGLFGLLGSGAAISNLHLSAVDVNGTGTYVAGLVGYKDGGSISGSYVTGTVTGNSGVGGLVAANGGGLFTCYSSASVHGSSYVGGLAGYSGGGGVVSKSGGTGSVTGGSRVGGLVGSNEGSISGSYSAGTVDGGSGVGGLTGYNFGSIAATYSVAGVSGHGVSIGGLVGHNAEGAAVSASYSAGAVTGSDSTGGLIGANDGNVTRSFWDLDASNQVDSAGGTGLTTTLMQDINVYLEAGWDFIDESANGTGDIWRMDSAQAYPSLSWQLIDEETTVGVYRLWSPISQRHFYTIDEAEKDAFLQDANQAWEDQGVVFSAYDSDAEPNVVPVFRFYAPSLDTHFYTAGASERDKLVNDFADVWVYEQIAFYAFPEDAQLPDTAPVYRFWSDALRCHFYTIDEDEKDRLLNEQPDLWIEEGVAWYAYPPVPSNAEL